MNPKLVGRRPWLAAGNALNLTHEGAERQRIGEVAAYPALVIAKRRDRLDHAGQLARRPLPDEGGAVAKLGQRYLQSVERNGPVSPRRTWHGAGKGGGLLGGQGAFGVDDHRAGIVRFLGKERKRGGGDLEKCECPRPNDDRSVAMDRRITDRSPKLVPRHQLSTGMRVQYQGEEIVNVRFVVDGGSRLKRTA